MDTTSIKPFDLDAALNGEPVMLRNGSKAYVRHHETELPLANNLRLFGIVLDEEGRVAKMPTWNPEGRYSGDLVEDREDIIGMWPKTRIFNGIEVLAPVEVAPKVGCRYYAVDFTRKEMFSEFTWNNDSVDGALLSHGLVFLSQGDAIATAKAMLAINPYDEVEE